MAQNATKLNVSNRHLLLAGLLTGVFALSFLVSAPSMAQHFTSPESAKLYQSITQHEQTLYGRAYPMDGANVRMERLEKTLFSTRQGGTPDQRLQRINQQMAARSQASFNSEQLPILEYLEEKLFQQTYPAAPMALRLERLETHVFGKSFGEYPMDIRMKKLTYAMPLVAKEIRVSNTQGQVVASTARKTQPLSIRTVDAKPEEMTLLDATAHPPVAPMVTVAPVVPITEVSKTNSVASTPIIDNIPTPAPTPTPTQRVLQDGTSISTGDYYQSIYRRADGRVVRWSELPMKVFIRGNVAEKDDTLEAIQLWQRSFSINVVDNALTADVIIDWMNSNRPIGPFTQPIMNMDNQRRVRTIVLINMTPFRSLEKPQQRHALLHQIGHAAGLWGHSTNANDVMHPALDLERTDIPRSLSNRTTPGFFSEASGMVSQNAAPSQRDINTLLKLYNLPEQDLKSFTPY